MKWLILFTAFSITALNALSIGPWQNIRFSGKTQSSDTFVRMEIDSVNITKNKLIYHNGTVMTEQDQSIYQTSTNTYQSVFPVTDARKYLGLRAAFSNRPDHLLPVYYEGTVLPTLSQMNQVSADASSDQSTNYLDIINDYFTFSDTRFYAAMQNRGGGFPTSAGLGTIYLSYMSVIANPNDDPNSPSTIVWAMNYMNVPLGGLSPGLFRIQNGELIRIGNIESSTVSGSNLLIMSCSITDLLADPAFAAWYNPNNPVLGFTSLTSRTTVIPFETIQTDKSPGAIIYPKKLYFDPLPNSSPILSNPIFLVGNDSIRFEITYTDAEGNFPLTAKVKLADNQEFNLITDSVNFSLPAAFSTGNIIDTINEYDNAAAVFRFSDNDIDFVTTEQNFTYIRSLKKPMEVALSVSEGNLVLNWEPVTQTLLGNPVSVPLYRIEVSSEPLFSAYEVLDITGGTSLILPINLLSDYQFFRIVGVK